MASVNKVILIGHAGREPESRTMPNGDQVTNVQLATTEKWTQGDGTKREQTEWHRIVFYRKLAEIAGKYIKKGSQVYIEGRLQTRKFTDKGGVERFVTEVVAEQMQLLGNRPTNPPDPAGTEDTTRSSGDDRQDTGSATPEVDAYRNAFNDQPTPNDNSPDKPAGDRSSRKK